MVLFYQLKNIKIHIHKPIIKYCGKDCTQVNVKILGQRNRDWNKIFNWNNITFMDALCYNASINV